MTRKRFVKLAMSCGMQRNIAERMARMASGAVSHAEIFETVSEWISELDPEVLKELARPDED